MSKYCLKENHVTDEKLFNQRRAIIKSSLAFSLLTFSNLLFSNDKKLIFSKDMKYSTNEETNTYKQITSYNNFYEFGTHKKHPHLNSGNFKPRPWTIKIDGLVKKPQTLDLEKILSKVTIEDRVYRLRCVEAWSMVIPWQGFQLSELIKMVEPLSSAKYVQFVTVFRPEEMPGQQKRTIIWPYREGLRMDEAMNPLTILATGLYGHEMPNQNGAPIRLVVPWKYGFKSIKSIVEIRFLDTQPETSWETLAPWEYGFYANVNPNVNHPRWSQGTERRIGEFKRRETLMFNGYEEEVAHLYKDLDLTKFY